ncbi:MAG: transglycosylase domain-containing protein [Bacteroidales bacterium]|nr:transglycosylase domain-containing protein [Bacteroidales bacterium]HOY38896.1 transglycosylase domain-containing protein [Bacteroidales bacterium]HQP04277.1 transglycosylase domain-containing protein [Bacteroidales bacterium]
MSTSKFTKKTGNKLNNNNISTPEFRKKFLKYFWSTYIIIVFLTIIYFVLISAGALGFMPNFYQLENPNNNLASKIISSDQVVLGTYFRENRSQISFVDLSPHLVNALIATEDIRFYRHSGIDFRALGRVFSGIATGNTKGGGSTITQQLAKMLFPREGDISKLGFMNRKFREWVIAVKLEKSYTKEEIIAMYFNRFDFLNLAVGIESAAKVYFNTTPDSLTIPQAAMLVGMAKNPSLYNPLRRPEETLKRRNVVLAQMKKYDFITKEQFDSLKNTGLGIKFQKVDHNIGSATYFREFLRMWLTAEKPIESNYVDKRMYVEDSINWYTDPSYGWCNKNVKADGSNYDIYSDGLKIYTTINSHMQKYAEEALTEHMSTYLQDEFFKDQKKRKKAPFAEDMTAEQIDNLMTLSMKRSERYRVLKAENMPEADIIKSFNTPAHMSVFSWKGDIDTVMTPMDSIKYYKFYLRAGFMSMEPQTGYVRAYVGGTNYQHFKFDQVSVARRQVGSTFKPFIYCLAMQNGYSPCYKVPNIPVTFELPDGSGQKFYTPKYSPSDKDGAMISLKYGLAGSLNQISAWVLKQFSPEAAVNLAKKMGVYSHIDPYPSICVGSAEVLLKEMVGGYCTFANKGIYTRPMYVTRIEDKDGNVLCTFNPIQKEAISEETAYLMLDLMRGVVDFGTSVRIRYKYNLKNDLAGKTGTTNNHSDGWFIGIAPQLVSGAWVGGEERSIHFRTITLGQGAVMALPIWALYMQKVYADKSLPYSTEKRFERPDKISVETDCETYDVQNQETPFIEF